MSGNFNLIDLEIQRGSFNGVDYAPKAKIFARTQELVLVWLPGHSFYSKAHYGMLEYIPGQMRVIPRKIAGHRTMGDDYIICDGVRLKQSIFETYADKIDHFFGEGFHALLSTKHTLVIGDNEPFIYSEVPLTGREFGYAHVMKDIEIQKAIAAEGLTGIEAMSERFKRMQSWQDSLPPSPMQQRRDLRDKLKEEAK